MTLSFYPLQKWVHVHWNNSGPRTKFSAVKELRALEEFLKQKGLKGWTMESDKSHTTMHRIIAKLGGQIYGENETAIFFKKEIK